MHLVSSLLVIITCEVKQYTEKLLWGN